MEILTKVVEKSWPERLREMKVGEVIHVDYRKVSSIRVAISHRLKYHHPEMAFETKKESKTVDGKDFAYLMVKRTA